MKIFLIAGKAHSGKATIANIIKEYYKDDLTIITEYSKYLKLYAKEILGWDGSYETKPRAFLQELGYDIRKNMDKNFFIKRMLEDIEIYQKYTNVSNLVIADIRYPEEIDAIKNKFEDVIVIYTVNEFGDSLLTEEERKHISEIALADYKEFNYVVHNNNIEKLKEEIENIMKENE